MTIYATEYKQSTKQAGPSMDSGFESLDQVEQMLGVERKHPRMILIGDGEDRVAYSDFIFCIDGTATTG